MIDSALFSRATAFENMQEWKADLTDNQKMVNRSMLYHMILSFATTISEDTNLMQVEKNQIVTQFGFTLGKNITEEQSLGNIKFFLPKAEKDKPKPFLGQFKFINGKLWPLIFGSISKLYAIVPGGGETGGYKIEDRDFGLTKWLSGNEQKVKLLRKLLTELSKGVIQGILDRFDLVGDVAYSQISDNNINFQAKNLNKKLKTAFK